VRGGGRGGDGFPPHACVRVCGGPAAAAGTLGYIEFERLLGTLESWRRVFEAADRDRSGRLSGPEVKASIRSLGFSLPEPVLDTIYLAYDDE
jgi:hypothetical protein